MARKWFGVIRGNVTFEDETFHLPRFMNALDRNNITVVKQFLQRGQDPNSHSGDYITGLHIAAIQNYYNLAKILLIHPKTQVNCVDTRGKTPISYAAKFNHPAVLKLLIEYGADIEISDTNGYTPLHYSVLWKNLEVAEILLANNANVQAENAFGKTALYLACLENPSCEIIKILTSHGADINLSNGKTLPILLEVCLICKSFVEEEIIELLIHLGAEVDIQSRYDRKTALHIAAITGYVPLAEILCTSGADPDMCDSEWRTPRDIAVQLENFGIVAYLDEFMRKKKSVSQSNQKVNVSKQQLKLKSAKEKKKKKEPTYVSVYK